MSVAAAETGLAPESRLFRFSECHPLCELDVSIAYSPTKRSAAALLLMALGIAHPALSADVVAPARFSGQASITTATPASSDGRFQLDAALSVTAPPSGDERFSLNAKLAPDPKSVTGSCAPAGSTIFRNGFE